MLDCKWNFWLLEHIRLWIFFVIDAFIEEYTTISILVIWNKQALIGSVFLPLHRTMNRHAASQQNAYLIAPRNRFFTEPLLNCSLQAVSWQNPLAVINIFMPKATWRHIGAKKEQFVSVLNATTLRMWLPGCVTPRPQGSIQLVQEPFAKGRLRLDTGRVLWGDWSGHC